MLQMDFVAAEEAALNTLPFYRCPECRAGTFLPCSERPINHSLSRILQLEDGYAEREAQVGKEKQEWLEDDANEYGISDCPPVCSNGQEEEPQNLAFIASVSRHRRALTLFRRLLPALQNAALRGASRLVITTQARDLTEMAKEIAAMLFPYGIHSVVAHVREFSINILREDGRYSWSTGEFTNEEYVDPPRPRALQTLQENSEGLESMCGLPTDTYRYKVSDFGEKF